MWIAADLRRWTLVEGIATICHFRGHSSSAFALEILIRRWRCGVNEAGRAEVRPTAPQGGEWAAQPVCYLHRSSWVEPEMTRECNKAESPNGEGPESRQGRPFLRRHTEDVLVLKLLGVARALMAETGSTRRMRILAERRETWPVSKFDQALPRQGVRRSRQAVLRHSRGCDRDERHEESRGDVARDDQ
jgi:hypothetical protein